MPSISNWPIFGVEIILVYNSNAMKKLVHLIALAAFVSSWGYTGGVSVRYPVLERILAHLDSQLPADLAREVRSHTDASSMCGVHGVVQANKHAFSTGSGASVSVSHIVLPISSFVLKPVVNERPAYAFLVLPSGSISSSVLLQPPRLAA